MVNIRIRVTDPPSERDSTTTDVLERERICEDIGNSGVFAPYNLYPFEDGVVL